MKFYLIRKLKCILNNIKIANFSRPTLHSKKICDHLYRELDENEKSNHFLFIHIPKTAGTSFRKALEDKFIVLGDYGEQSKFTAKQIQNYIYKEKSPLAFKNYLKKNRCVWITGHFSFSRYSDMVSARHIITFVRNPIQQVISHYNHYVALHGFKGSIEDFLKKPMASNFQRKNLNPLPLGLIGYVGLTDCYDESIELINDYYGLNLDVKNANVNNKKTIEKEAISIDLQKQITELNLLDIACVEQAHFLHHQRVALAKENKEWVYSDFTINPHNVLVGCAYYSHSAKPVEFDVFCNGELLDSFTAQGFYGGFAKVNFPRERYIGVHISLTKLTKKGDKLEVFAKETGQQLTYRSLILNK